MNAAQQFSVDKQDWVDAATQLRLPFWDWADNAVLPDVVINSTTVTITDYDGQKIKVNNPLMHYRFQKSEPFSTPFNGYRTTLRHPNSKGVENIAQLKK